MLWFEHVLFIYLLLGLRTLAMRRLLHLGDSGAVVNVMVPRVEERIPEQRTEPQATV